MSPEITISGLVRSKLHNIQTKSQAPLGGGGGGFPSRTGGMVQAKKEGNDPLMAPQDNRDFITESDNTGNTTNKMRGQN